MFENLSSDLESSALSLIEGEKNLVANLANLSSHIYYSMPNLNWCGFYLWSDQDQELVLGPFQGKVACIRIRADRGVCGKAYSTKQTLLVNDVHAFPGHIACDAASNSELVIPLIVNDRCVGVLDLDSPMKDRFTQDDANRLQSLMKKITPLLWVL